MKTDKVSVSDLFDKPRRYLVPIFQRGYVWTREDQWEPLWKDILHQVAQVHKSRNDPVPYTKRHFLGAFVLNQATLGVRHTPAADVIDGQQRITTLQLLLIAFRDFAKTLPGTFLSARLERLTENPPPVYQDVEKLKVWPTSAFREDIERVTTSGSKTVVIERFPIRKDGRKVIPRAQVAEAYLYFYDSISAFIENGNGSDVEEDLEVQESNREELVEDLLTGITSHIQLVEILLDAEDDAQIIFETLNARGAPLSASDLVRNFVFLYATRKGEDVVEIYDKFWKDFDEAPDTTPRSKTKRFWREEERQGRLKTPRLDLLLFHYLAFRTKKELKISHVFQEFRDWWEGAIPDRVAEEELRSLKASSAVFRQLLQPNVDTEFGQFANRLKILDVSTVYPLVLFLHDRKSTMSESDFNTILVDLESFLVRRAVCDLTSKGYNRVFLSFVKTLSEQEAVTPQSFRKLLSAGAGESSIWPDDDQFRKSFVDGPLYERANGRLARLILDVLEKHLRTNKNEDVRIVSSLSVEHIWPQTPAAEAWEEKHVRADGTFDYEAWATNRRVKHSIGNLTLITGAFNSSLSNRSFAEKRPAIIRESLLRLNAYFQGFSDDDDWTHNEIRKRGNVLFELAHKVWPHPASI